MDIKRIKDKNTLEDPTVLEVALAILPILINTIPIIQIYQNNKNLEIENQLGKINEEISNLQNISDQIMEILAIASSRKHFNLDAKVSIKDTLLLLKQDDLFRWMQLERALKKIDIEIYNLKYDLRSDAIKNNRNFDIDVNDHLVTSLDLILSNMDEMSFVEFISSLTDSISEISKRLVDLNSPKLR